MAWVGIPCWEGEQAWACHFPEAGRPLVQGSQKQEQLLEQGPAQGVGPLLAQGLELEEEELVQELELGLVLELVRCDGLLSLVCATEC